MHRRLLLLSLMLLAACAPQALPTSAPFTPAVPSDTPPAAITSGLPASPTDTLTPTAPPTLTFTPTVTEVPVLPTTPVAVAVTTVAPGSDITLTPQPGLIIRGHVLLVDGTGVANVSICRNFASYPGTVVAKTDANGYFQSDFASIPGDEMVGVWPMAPGYTFKPDNYRWRHYYGSEDRSLDFIAVPSLGTAVAPFPCQ